MLRERDLNSRPSDYDSDELPTVLSRIKIIDFKVYFDKYFYWCWTFSLPDLLKYLNDFTGNKPEVKRFLKIFEQKKT